MDSRAKMKREKLEQALEHGVAMLHLDARRPGVRVPQQHRNDCQLCLNFSLRFRPPDLEVSDWGVRETLSFAGRPFCVAVPWSAIFGITGSDKSQQYWIFQEDVPVELLEAAARRCGLPDDEIKKVKEAQKLQQDQRAVTTPAEFTPRRGLRVVESNENTVALVAENVAEGVHQERESEKSPEESASASEKKIEDKSEESSEKKPDDTAGKPRRSHLRLVK